MPSTIDGARGVLHRAMRTIITPGNTRLCLPAWAKGRPPGEDRLCDARSLVSDIRGPQPGVERDYCPLPEMEFCTSANTSDVGVHLLMALGGVVLLALAFWLRFKGKCCMHLSA